LDWFREEACTFGAVCEGTHGQRPGAWLEHKRDEEAQGNRSPICNFTHSPRGTHYEQFGRIKPPANSSSDEFSIGSAA
jgi:hypothetical protein